MTQKIAVPVAVLTDVVLAIWREHGLTAAELVGGGWPLFHAAMQEAVSYKWPPQLRRPSDADLRAVYEAVSSQAVQ